MNYPRKNLIYLKQVYTFQESEIFTTFENIRRSFLNNLKSEETKSQIKVHLLYLANSYFITTNLLHVYYVNITSYETLERMQILL